MPPGLMSRRKSRHLVWEMGTVDWGLGIGDWGIGESGLANGEWEMENGEWGSRKVLPPAGKASSP